MSTWFEVYHEKLPLKVTVPTEEDARKLAESFDGLAANGVWRYRRVGVNDCPRPPQAPEPTHPTVEELLQLMLQHGQDVAVLFVWNSKTGPTVLTAGHQEQDSLAAIEAGQKLRVALGLGDDMTEIENRTDEHGPCGTPSN